MELLVLLQIEGIGLNATTFGIVSMVVAALVSTIIFLFKWATAQQAASSAREIARLEQDKKALEEDKQQILETLIDVLRTAHRSTDAADEATQELLKRQTRKPAR